MARNSFEQSQNGRGAIKSVKSHTQKVGEGGGDSKCVDMLTRGDMRGIKKSIITSVRIK